MQALQTKSTRQEGLPGALYKGVQASSDSLKTVIAVLFVSLHLPAQDIRSTDPKQRVKAIRELGKQASPSAIEQLTPLLSDPEVNVRAEAVKAIVQVRTGVSPSDELAGRDHRLRTRPRRALQGTEVGGLRARITKVCNGKARQASPG